MDRRPEGWIVVVTLAQVIVQDHADQVWHVVAKFVCPVGVVEFLIGFAEVDSSANACGYRARAGSVLGLWERSFVTRRRLSLLK